MPIKHETWECRFCGEKFALESEAVRCENSHYTLLEIKETHYSPFNKRYPDAVKISFPDGNVKVYESVDD